MPLSRSRDYLSIGEVLDAVRPEFPDVSISKIRFLESEGLLEPERTQAGYRKFYEKDVERLRYILTLQRDHFLPLKVIKDRISAGEDLGPLPDAPAPATVPAAHGNGVTGPQEPPQGVQLDRDELQTASGLSEHDLTGILDFGLLDTKERYDENDLLVAKAAAGFLALGIEPRHLRMYRQFAERESGFFEQLLSPALRRKDPDAGRQAAETLRKLEGLSRSMREGLLRTGLRELL